MDTNPYEAPQAGSSAADSFPLRKPDRWTLNAPNLFGVGIRTLGLVLLIYNAWAAAGALMPQTPYSPGDYIVGAGVGFGIGLALLFGADKIVDFVYGARPGDLVD